MRRLQNGEYFDRQNTIVSIGILHIIQIFLQIERWLSVIMLSRACWGEQEGVSFFLTDVRQTLFSRNQRQSLR